MNTSRPKVSTISELNWKKKSFADKFYYVFGTIIGIIVLLGGMFLLVFLVVKLIKFFWFL